MQICCRLVVEYSRKLTVWFRKEGGAMLKRKVDSVLEEYLTKDTSKCLMIRGARQVGKSFSVDRLGNSSAVSSYIRVNFLEKPGLMKIFSGDLDIDTLVTNFSLYMPEARFVPGSTLLFLDEIQECPEAITSLKFWARDPRFKVIASGSMLGIDYKRSNSYPVGSIQYLDMKPLSFMEFLWAMGISSSTINRVREYFTKREMVPDAIHQSMLHYLKLYLVLGGMPEVVQKYCDTKNMAEADSIQRSILIDYRQDIAHYALPSIKIKAEKCFFSLPDQLGKENHKFQYSLVERGGTARKFGDSIDWLTAADLVHPCASVTKVEYPLRSFVKEGDFRLYPNDTGLLLGMYDYSMKQAIFGDTEKAPVLLQAKGGLYEALIASMLLQNGHEELYFYKNETTRTEIEFLIPGEEGVIPIEAKAGNNRSKSLDRVLKDEHIPYGYKLISGNVGVTGKKITLPLYMAMFI